jgi:DNA-binding transcriptional regulator YiaG
VTTVIESRAHRAVRWALTTGALERPECCETCGRAVRLDAHHEDYARALDVRWLCRRCHGRVHCCTFTPTHLEALLDERGLRPVDLAALLRLPYGTVDGWVRGRRRPRHASARRLGEFFGVDWRSFYGEAQAA